MRWWRDAGARRPGAEGEHRGPRHDGWLHPRRAGRGPALQDQGPVRRRVAVYMAGHVAEEMVFEEQSTGAANDIERATGLARRMVTEFGMSRTLGPRAFGKKTSSSSSGGRSTSSEITATRWHTRSTRRSRN